MELFKPESLFNLNHYNHPALFDRIHFVWEALNFIKAYLNTTPLGLIHGNISPGAYLIDPDRISIGEGSVVEPGAYIHGPCIIGDHCTVRHGAYIRGDFICGNHCVIGHDTEIKHSIFLDGVHAAHFAYVGDSILGNHVNLGAGTKCANLKLDRTNVMIYCNNEKVDTGLRKLGAILGDHVQTGCNSVTNPGTIMGRHAICYPNVTVSGVIPSDSIARPAESFNILKRHRESQ